jgi:hypothetical protein
MATAGALLGACGSSSSPGTAAADQAFLAVLHSADPQINLERSNQALLRLGEAACAEFSSGASFASVADQLQAGAAGLSTEDLGTLLTAAANDLCPRYRQAAGV